jgi:hypothetical protein
MADVPEYHVIARNCSTESENIIHADAAARQFGFKGGLVPGVVIFGYAIKPVMDLYGTAWLQHGSVQIKLHKPVYDGDAVVVRAHTHPQSTSVEFALSAQRGHEEVCASGEASLIQAGGQCATWDLKDFPELAIPTPNERPVASTGLLAPGRVLGTINQNLDSFQSRVFAALNEMNSLFIGPESIAHPAVLLELANQALMRNFRLGPWLHTASSVTNWSPARNGEAIQVRSRVAACYEHKGHEFVILNLVLLGPGNRLIQQVAHTAIFRPKFVAD